MTGNLDVVGRREGHDLRASTAIDAEDGLQRLYATNLKRRTHTRIVAVAVMLGAMSVGLLGHGVLAREDEAPSHPAPRNVDPQCQVARVQCLGNGGLLVDLADPLRWDIPNYYSLTEGYPTATQVRAEDGGGFWGVIVAEKVHPATASGQAASGFGTSPSPHRFAEWLTSRPYLDATTPTPTHLAGHEAWRVRARIAQGAGPEKGHCGLQGACYPVLVSGTADTSARRDLPPIGMWGDMVADYTFVSLPSGTAVAVSWNFKANQNLGLEINGHVIDGITWLGD